MEKKRVEKQDFNLERLEKEYFNCIFEGCDFSKMRISDVYFEDCTFNSCNLSNTKFCNVLRDCTFVECKMTGCDFSEISRFALSLGFERCMLHYSSFVELKLKSTKFLECDLTEAYFDSANLTSSLFDNCNLSNTSFHDTNLEAVDFSSSYNLTINPNLCKLKKTIFSESELRGLVAHLDIKIKSLGEL